MQPAESDVSAKGGSEDHEQAQKPLPSEHLDQDNTSQRNKLAAVSELQFWLIYSVLLGIVPLVILAFLGLLVDVLSHGELFIISLSLSGERLGRMYVYDKERKIGYYSAFLLAFLSAICGINSVNRQDEVPLIITLSVVVFVFTVACGIVSLRGKKDV